MLYNPPRMYADWFADPEHGINAMLLLVPRDVDTPLPDPFALIAVESKDGNVARAQLPATLPACTISADHVVDEDGQIQTVNGDGIVKLRFRIGVKNPTTAEAIAELGIRIRAVKWSARRFTDERFNPQDAGNRTRNGIYLETCNALAEQIAWATGQPESNIVSGYVLGDFKVRDLTPMGV